MRQSQTTVATLATRSAPAAPAPVSTGRVSRLPPLLNRSSTGYTFSTVPTINNATRSANRRPVTVMITPVEPEEDREGTVEAAAGEHRQHDNHTDPCWSCLPVGATRRSLREKGVAVAEKLWAYEDSQPQIQSTSSIQPPLPLTDIEILQGIAVVDAGWSKKRINSGAPVSEDLFARYFFDVWNRLARREETEGAYDPHGELFFMVEAYKARNPTPRDDRRYVPANEISWQCYAKVAGENTKNLKLILLMDINNKGFWSITAHNYEEVGKSTDEIAVWERGDDSDSLKRFERFLGGDIMNGILLALANHHNAIGDKTISKIITISGSLSKQKQFVAALALEK
ncbi:Uu.00g041980.m01.CDS01 [Anthostomella pinea]|uniref:Uu.00g041980.m01.CDS01 n=1 Tax=Anthostomella pinea TaxID=933095 RepID=A0AAI8YE24_9PEZI|nr:Uu.00g041980.m01.CDS01 [Anthostomella pinea]